MDRISDFTDGLIWCMVEESYTTAVEAAGARLSSDVVTRTSEYDRLAMSGLLTTLDDLKDEVKALKKLKSATADPDQVIRQCDDVLKRLRALDSEVSKITADPKREKTETKAVTTICLAVCTICYAIYGGLLAGAAGVVVGGGIVGGASAYATHKMLKTVDAKKNTRKEITKAIATIENIKSMAREAKSNGTTMRFTN